MQERQVFKLRVLDENGSLVNANHYVPNSLLAAALVGHVFQTQNGYRVTITDTSEHRHREYRIDAHGKPVPIESSTLNE
jgi:hypothetical protein